jgi:hypothetical protein
MQTKLKTVKEEIKADFIEHSAQMIKDAIDRVQVKHSEELKDLKEHIKS